MLGCVMSYLRTFFRLLTRLSGLPGRFIRFFRSDPRSRQRPPELAELEAQFYQDAGQNPERVRNRQFSTSFRSGRG